MQGRHNHNNHAPASINVMTRLEALLGISRCNVFLQAIRRFNVVLNAAYNRILIRTIVQRLTRRVMPVVSLGTFLVSVVPLMQSLGKGTSDNQARVPASAVTGVENPFVVVSPCNNRCTTTVLLSLN